MNPGAHHHRGGQAPREFLGQRARERLLAVRRDGDDRARDADPGRSVPGRVRLGEDDAADVWPLPAGDRDDEIVAGTADDGPEAAVAPAGGYDERRDRLLGHGAE